MRGKKGAINFYCRPSVIKTIRAQLEVGKDDPASIYAKFRDSSFGKYLEYNPEGRCANSAIFAVIAQQVTRPDERPDEAWFRVGESLARFSKKEFAVVTGLRFGTSEFDVRAKHKHPVGGLYMRHIHDKNRTPLYSSVLEHFSRGDFAGSPDDELKFAKLLFLYGFLLGIDTGKKSIDPWAWTLIEDEEKWESFPWGSYIFDDLINRLNKLSPTSHNDEFYRAHFYGFSTAFVVC